VARIAVCLAGEMRLGNDELEALYLGGLLHDIGKIGIDDRVLNKPGPLTFEEFEQVKLHPKFGYDLLQGVRPLEKVLPMVLYHHEAWDGTGYPQQLKGDETPRLARIMAVADACDAMSSDRPYRPGLAEDEVDELFREGAGRQWAPEVVAALFARREEIHRITAEGAVGNVSLEPLLG
jgi:HD-GYP domain-containing protein (c-di-GMP phosphodiesterase class II)